MYHSSPEVNDSHIFSPTRIKWADYARGISIFFVAISHFGVNGHSFGPFYSYFFLTLFFFVSGFLFKNVCFKQFITRLFRGIVIPLLIFTFILNFVNRTFLTILLQGDIGGIYEALKGFIRDVAAGKSLWFLNCLVIVQILFWLIYNLLILRISKAKATCAQCICSVCLLLLIFIINSETGRSMVWNIDTAVFATGFFSIGNLFRKFYPSVQIRSFCNTDLVTMNSSANLKVGKIIHNTPPLLSISLLVIYLIVMYSFSCFSLPTDVHHNMFGNPLIYLISSIVSVFVMTLMCISVPFGKLLSFWGQHSLTIYALQGYGYSALDAILRLLGLGKCVTLYPNISTIVIAIWICSVCAFVSYIATKYAPFIVGKRVNK